MSNRAWVTLATNDSYGLGALVLAHSLRRANSAHPAVVLITPAVTEAMRNRLSSVFAEVITVNVLDSQDAAHLALLQRPELGITFTKTHCWTLTQYEKCVFLDADTLIVQNCDELFDREELSAAPDVGWPDCFNSGVFVFVPSQETYSRLITFAQERGSFDGGDQGLLNAFFADWARGDINKHLPFLYNVTSAAFYSYIPALKHYGQDLKIIHFIGTAKPWLQQFNWESRSVDAPEHLRGFLQLWWDLFVGQVHFQLDTAMESAVEEEQGSLEPPPENPPDDTLHHYEPEITADSEFPWHWPEAHTQETESQTYNVNMSEIHDPWKHYRGNIPPRQEYSSQNSEFGGSQREQEIRKYAWEYRESYEQPPEHNYHQHHEHHTNHDSHTHQHDSHTPQHDFHLHRQDHHPQEHSSQQQEHHYHRQEHHQKHNNNEHQHYEHAAHHWQDHFKNQNHNYHPEIYQRPSVEHEASHAQQNQSQHEHSSFEQNPDHSFQSQQVSQFIDHSHGSNHNYQSNYNFNQFNSKESNKHDYFDNHDKRDQEHNFHQTHMAPENHSEKHSEISFDRQHNGYRHFPYTNPTNAEQVYHVYLDHRPLRRHHRHRRLDSLLEVRSNGVANGHESDSDSEEEFIIPRHPYDGFFLRHRPTIDSRGRKICIHEIPPTPLPSPPAEEPSSRESSPIPSEAYSTASECEDQYSGVAGNLARVVPGSGGYQNEAIDELTRRQGWEAGNIDYMGADSFDNIWAKISQTLSQQPPKQPTPPKEPSPPKEQPPAPVPEAAPTPVPEPTVEAAPAPTSAPAAAPAVEATTVAAAAPEPAPAASPAPEPTPAPASEPAPAPAPAAALESTPAPASASAESLAPQTETPVQAPAPVEAPKPEAPAQKTEPQVPPTPPATPKSTPEASSPVTESAPVVPKAAEAAAAAPASPAPAAEAPTKPAATPEKSQDSSVSTASSDSPPLAHTPSKEEAPVVSPSKTEERRKPVEKLQLSPPAAADALPTPDSELEDAASLAQAIIASELSTAVTAPTPAADVSPTPPLEEKRLSVEAPDVTTPPVSLAQIGVKPKGKTTTAAQIESSVTEKAEQALPAETTPSESKPAEAAPAEASSVEAKPAEATPVETKAAEAATPETPATPTSPTTPAPPGDAPKKKTVKKVVKKEAGASGDAPTPVPPPRKKEKKPKEK